MMKDQKYLLQSRREKALCENGALNVLFIGNSATYVHDIPQTLCRLAGEAGYCIEATSVVKGGYELSRHADAETAHGKRVLAEIRRGYDVVFLQDNGNCITSEAKRAACEASCKALHDVIAASGAETFFYVRPPYGTDHAQYSPLEQCVAFDALFGGLARDLGAVCAYVNRAFAYAMKHLPFDLWGPDHAHTSERGAYLATCIFFVTLFGTSATVLGNHGLPHEDARALQEAADRIVLADFLPW